MMSDKIYTTPRPRPPAKTRRTPSFPKFPPPPYAPSLDQLVLDASFSIPEHIDASALDSLPSRQEALDADDWTKEKSREELSELLLRADEIIKSRESELSLTSALCKNFYNDNVALKSKHETLLARLPTSPGPSAPNSPNSPTSPALHRSFGDALSPQSSDASLPATPAYPSSLSLSPPRTVPRHARRISVTVSDLARLADQNAELLDKLEHLEAESVQSDQAGRRRLRKLEQEIQGLRVELEQTQAKDAERDEQVRAVLSASMSEAEAERRRLEREERVRPFKEKSGSVMSEDAMEEIRDFAPPSEIPRSTGQGVPSGDHSQSEENVSSAAESSPQAVTSPFALPDGLALVPSISRSRLKSSCSQSGAELAIVAQLILKIQELERTNAQIKEERKQTEERLRAAQWNAESIRRVYDCLDGDADIELEVVSEDGPEDSLLKGRRVVSGETVKFSSLRRTIHQDLSISKLLEQGERDGFALGILSDMQSTVRSSVVPQKHVGGHSHKSRKSVVGLFDSRPTKSNLNDRPASSWRSSPFPVSPGDNESELGDISTWSTAATDGMAPPSPTLSGLQTPIESPGFGRTLGSELGSEFGDDWGMNAGNHHLRTTSLYEISSLDLAREASVSPSVSERPMFAFPALGEPNIANATLTSTPRKGEEDNDTNSGPSTPPVNLTGLQLNVEPPTPDKRPKLPSARAYRLSQTVRSRTHRWVEGRYSPATSPEPVKRRPVPSVRRRTGMEASALTSQMLDEAESSASIRRHARSRSRGHMPDFGAAGREGGDGDSYSYSRAAGRKGKHRSRSDDEDDADGEGEVEGNADLSAVQLRADTSGVVDPAGERKEGFAGFVLEAWLWLQFVIVIVVFIWAMAKRGPKSVMEDVDLRRAHGQGSGARAGRR